MGFRLTQVGLTSKNNGSGKGEASNSSNEPNSERTSQKKKNKKQFTSKSGNHNNIGLRIGNDEQWSLKQRRVLSESLIPRGTRLLFAPHFLRTEKIIPGSEGAQYQWHCKEEVVDSGDFNY